MNNLPRLLLVSSLLALASHATFASGLYMFGQFGRLYHDDLPNIADTERNTIEKYGYRLGAGYNIAQNETSDLGMMLGFGYYGKTIWNNSNNNAAYAHTMYGYDLQAVGTYHTNPVFDFMLHGGLVLMQDKVISNFTTENKNHVRPIVGAGAAWNFDPNLSVTFDYDHIFGQRINQGNFDRQPSVDAYWLGLIYRFNSFAN